MSARQAAWREMQRKATEALGRALTAEDLEVLLWKLETFEAALGRPATIEDVATSGIRSDGSVKVYDRPVTSPDRKCIAVHANGRKTSAHRPPSVRTITARPRTRGAGRPKARTARTAQSSSPDSSDPAPPPRRARLLAAVFLVAGSIA